MKNFEFEHDGKTYWYSRSIACVNYVYAINKEGQLCVLTVKRGPNAATNKGKWSVPGGYLDFDETLQECAVRECREETGLELYQLVNPSQITMVRIDDTARGEKQNIVVEFVTLLPDPAETYKDMFSLANMEPGEIECIDWANVLEMEKEKRWSYNLPRKVLRNALRLNLTNIKVTEALNQINLEK